MARSNAQSVLLDIAGVRFSFSASRRQHQRLRHRYGPFVRLGSAAAVAEPHPPAVLLELCADLRHFDLAIRQRLAQHLLGSGLLAHGAGIRRSGQGLLFFGPSGSGKSTVAQSAPQGAVALSDELTAVRRGPPGWALFGTPFWSGQDMSAPLSALFAIEHGEKDELVPLASTEVLRALLPQVVFPDEDPGRVFAHACRLAQEIPGYRLRFRKGADFWKVVDER